MQFFPSTPETTTPSWKRHQMIVRDTACVRAMETTQAMIQSSPYVFQKSPNRELSKIQD